MHPPTAKNLAKIQALGFWGEGVEGPLHLEIKSIAAGTKEDQTISFNMRK